MNDTATIKIHAINGSHAPLYNLNREEKEQAEGFLLVDLSSSPVQLHALRTGHPLVQRWDNAPSKVKLKLRAGTLACGINNLASEPDFINLLISLQQDYQRNPSHFDAENHLDARYAQTYLDCLPEASIITASCWLKSRINLRDFVNSGDFWRYAIFLGELLPHDYETVMAGFPDLSLYESLIALIDEQEQYLSDLPVLLQKAKSMLQDIGKNTAKPSPKTPTQSIN